MEYKYFPHTESEIKEMLDIVGVGSLDELYSDVRDGGEKILRSSGQ